MSNYVQRANQKSLGWPLPENLDEAALEEVAVSPRSAARAAAPTMCAAAFRNLRRCRLVAHGRDSDSKSDVTFIHLVSLDPEVGMQGIQYAIQVADSEAPADGDRCQFRILDLQLHRGVSIHLFNHFTQRLAGEGQVAFLP